MYKRLGYPWIPPELRENMGELEAAREGRLPQLVELADIRGDLHTHSTWSSDGKNTIEEMAREAKRLGRSYIASPTTRTTCARAGSRRRAGRSTRSRRSSAASSS